MSYSVVNVQPPLEFLAPDFNIWVWRFCRTGMPLWIRANTPIAEVQTQNIERLVELYSQFQQGKVRFLMAFRHLCVDDPYSISQLLWRQIPQMAHQKGIALADPVHAHFMYDRGIPVWAGSYVAWLFPKLGGTSIVRGKLDRQGLKSARHLMANGRFPLAAAPEGSTNGHNQRVSPLEPGVAQLGFWCAEDLQKAGRTEEVFIVPLGLQYSYLEENWGAIADLLSQMETDCGLSGPINSPENFEGLYPRLVNLGKHLLGLMENFYRQFYHQPLVTDESAELSTRLQQLLNTALQIAEDYFAVQAKGSLTDRCRRLEQAGWDCIYREDIKDVEALSAVERGLADRVAEEASLRMWHMRLVESFVAVSGRYVQENPTYDRFAETSLILWKTLVCLKGNEPIRRPNLGKQRVNLAVAEPLSVSQCWPDYKANRRQAVTDLTQTLQIVLEAMITP
ncbi:MAG: 1-acyl-sn-glycerol-3-phosphate acyltransferase [Oscillatoriales cyanobacterium RM2_1_1]|nr:1-acyl-sn-glycerol-3-phosphate acyltransferase [Oscillatoriales cyanobacterium SM2_3_0]NJO45527.1 1-acyl-sn-glycerol-3-phosphate acyltransferase [Oscillatoriales cyanobacterium RM2_1_1]